MSEGKDLYYEMSHSDNTILGLRDLVCKGADALICMEIERDELRKQLKDCDEALEKLRNDAYTAARLLIQSASGIEEKPCEANTGS